MLSENKTVSVTISYQKFDDSSLYRLKKKTVLRVVVGESLLGKHISILTNYPSNESTDFVRSQFESLQWYSKHGDKLVFKDNFAEIKDLDMYCQVTVQRSGTFKFYILEEEK